MNVSTVRRDYDDDGVLHHIFVGFHHYPYGENYGPERVDAGIILIRDDYEVDEMTDKEAIKLARERFKKLVDGEVS